MPMPVIRYFFADPPVKSRDFSIRGLGIQEPMKPGIVDRPQGTGDYLFMLLHEGVDIRVGDRIRSVPPTRLMIWEPADGHYYGTTTGPWRHSWIHCSGTWVRDQLMENRVPVRTPIAFPDVSVFEKHVLELHMELTGYARPDSTIVRNEFQNCIRQIARIARTGEAAHPLSPRMVQLRRFLDTHYHQKVTLNDLARRANISVPHLCNQFKKQFGVSPIQYVISLRMTRAAYLLHDRNLSITEIAEAVGYEDLFHFSRLFKKHHGKSPTAMRGALAARGG